MSTAAKTSVATKKTAIKHADKPVAPTNKVVSVAPAEKPATKAAPKVATPKVIKVVAPVVAKTSAKPATNVPAKKASQPSLKTAIVAESAPKKPRKEKVVRDSFSMPKADYVKLATLKKACLAAGFNVKKSELLRAGLHALEAMPIASLKTAVEALDVVATGRPPAGTQSGKKESTD